MTVRIRGDLAALPTNLVGPPAAGVIRLDLNELPHGPLPSALTAIAAAASSTNRYPDPAAVDLVERISQHVGTTADRVTVGCGSTSLCQQLVQATCNPDDEVIFGWPSFEAYPIFARIVGARSRPVPTTAGHGLDLDAMAAAVTHRTRLIFLCNPNNPTGAVLRRDQLSRFLDAVPPAVLVVLDEAYREFVTDPDLVDDVQLLTKRPNVAVLRTFSKAYGLAGLRVGYAIAAPEVIRAVHGVGVPFAVNALAQVAAIASLDAAGELLARCMDVVAERERVRDALLVAGYDVPESQANFLWLPLGERAALFAQHCRHHGVIVRAIASSGARVTIGTPAENRTYLAAARSYLQPSTPAITR